MNAGKEHLDVFDPGDLRAVHTKICAPAAKVSNGAIDGLSPDIAGLERACTTHADPAFGRRNRCIGVDDAEAEAYFAMRPRASQLGAWASKQSETLASRDAFERRVDELEQEFAGRDVPRPPRWGGFRVKPHAIEFWYGAQFRLHERYLYERDATGDWTKRMLYP